MIGLFNSEWIKTTTTKSPFWLIGIAAFLSVAFAGLMTYFPGPGDPPPPSFYQLLGITSGISAPLLWIVGVVAVTGEFRFGTIRQAFLADPRRWTVVAVKTVFHAVVAAVAMALILVVSFAVAGAVSRISGFEPFGSEALEVLWKLPIYTAIGSVLSIGLALLLRNAAGTIVLLLMWTSIVEGLVGLIPRIGEHIADWMPFHNGLYWTFGEEANMMNPFAQVEWGQNAALALFAAIAFAILLAGAVVTQRRDP